MKRKTLILLLLFLIVAAGVFMRAWHFSDWLHFELDQARDAKLVSAALEEGPENLPLLGPRAAGTFLRLGPVFYYFQYLSGLIFGNTPPGIAMFNLIFSIGAIILFYFFVREYFSKLISILLLAIFSSSLYLVMYSRFAWNPNSLIFFELLAFYALLKCVKKEEKRKGLWLLVFVLAMTIATQLHFLALLSLPVIGAIYLIVKRPKISWQYWASAFLIALFLYLPVILNETKTGGANAKEFLLAVSGKSNKDQHSLSGSIIRSFQENSLASWLVLSGNEKGKVLRPEQIQNPKVFCDKECRRELPFAVMAYVIFILGIAVLFKNILSSRDPQKRNFIWLTFIWLGVVCVLYVPLAYNMSPRFFLLLAPVYIVMLGFILEFLAISRKKWLVIAVALAFVFSNLYFTFQRFNQMKLASRQDVRIGADRILKEKARVTLEQQKAIVSYVVAKNKINALPIYVKSESQYDRAIKFLLSRSAAAAGDFNVDEFYRPGNYFLIWRTDSDLENKNAKYLPMFDIREKKSFGTLTVYYLQPKINFVRNLPEKKESAKPNSKVPRRYTWKEYFTGDEENDNDIDAEEELLIKDEGL